MICVNDTGRGMPRFKHYSPEIRRFLVAVLYHEAKLKGVPMTVLANQVLKDGLKDSAGWKTAEEWLRLQETTPGSQKT